MGALLHSANLLWVVGCATPGGGLGHPFLGVVGCTTPVVVGSPFSVACAQVQQVGGQCLLEMPRITSQAVLAAYAVCLSCVVLRLDQMLHLLSWQGVGFTAVKWFAYYGFERARMTHILSPRLKVGL